jgi:hypothetical protein
MSHTEPIASFGLLADCNSAALVSSNGSIDWLCFPRYDSPSVFGRLLDPSAGHWAINPAGGSRIDRRYESGTLAIATEFTTPQGTIRVVDALAFAPEQRGLDTPHEVLRLVEGVNGEVDVAMEFSPRPEYGLARPFIVRDGSLLRTRGGSSRLVMSCPVDVDINGSDATSRFTVHEGNSIGFALRWGPLSLPRRSRRPPEMWPNVWKTARPHGVTGNPSMTSTTGHRATRSCCRRAETGRCLREVTESNGRGKWWAT